jgi:hypothetical protein
MVFWNQYDIANAIIGGLLIGVATTLHLLVKGRITGFSGIYYSLVTLDPNSFIWKLALMSSIVAVSSGLFKAYGYFIATHYLSQDSGTQSSSPEPHHSSMTRPTCFDTTVSSASQSQDSSSGLEPSSLMGVQADMV